jgi:hypothetical protein
MLAAEEANKASQVHVATSGADRLFFMHQVITKIIPAAPSDVATSTQGRGKRRAGARLNVAAVQKYLKSLGLVSLGKSIFYDVFHCYYTMAGQVFQLFQEFCGLKSEFSVFFHHTNLTRLDKLLEGKSERSKIACLRRMFIFLTDKSEIGVPTVSQEDILALSSQRADRAEAHIVAFLEEVNKVVTGTGEVVTYESLHDNDAKFCDMVLNTWKFDDTLSQSVIKNKGLVGEFGSFVASRHTQMKAHEERAQLAAKSSVALGSSFSGDSDASLDVDDDEVEHKFAEEGGLSVTDNSKNSAGGSDAESVPDTVRSSSGKRLMQPSKKRSPAKRVRRKNGTPRGSSTVPEVSLPAADKSVPAGNEPAPTVLPREMTVDDKLKILESYGGSFCCSDTFPVGQKADLVILHDLAFDSEARSAVITSAAQTLTDSGTLVVMCDFFNGGAWKEEVKSLGNLIVEDCPLVVVLSSKASNPTNAVAFQHSGMFSLIIFYMLTFNSDTVCFNCA